MVVASPFDEVTGEVRRLLTCAPVLRIYRGRDLPGVELAASLADAHTVAIGLADGLGVSAASRAVLVTRAMAEAARLGGAAGADPRTFFGLAGLGNLLVRSSPAGTERSADYELGLRLARGEAVGEAATEGARAAAAGVRLAARRGVRMPVLAGLIAVLRGEMTPAQGAAAVADTVAAEE
jgi:glycerol-3-phosphate dehydrogenase (NAD(P)+)